MFTRMQEMWVYSPPKKKIKSPKTPGKKIKKKERKKSMGWQPTHACTTLKIIDSHCMLLALEAFLSLVECNHHQVQIVVKMSGICKEILGMNINLSTHASICVIKNY